MPIIITYKYKCKNFRRCKMYVERQKVASKGYYVCFNCKREGDEERRRIKRRELKMNK